jgi:hypothetical protein
MRAGMRAAFESALVVRRQIERLGHVDFDDPWANAYRSADLRFLILSLWRLRMAAEICADEAPGGAAAELVAAFDLAVPETRAMRNVLMHYDNYVLENDKRLNTNAATGRKVNRRDVESLYPSPDGFAWLGRDYYFADVDVATLALYRGLNELTGLQGFE